MKRPDTRAASLPSANEEKICPVIAEAVSSVPPGIVGTAVEPDGQSVTIDYDPRLINDESVREVAAKLAPEVQRRLDKCVMRLEGRACEACALKFERKAQRIAGVRRARATFIGGVMSVTFDKVQLSPEQVLERVREIGAPVTPFTAPRESPQGFTEWLQYHSGRIEIACTAVTFVFMIAGWFAPRVGLGQTWANLYFLIAYIAGGIFGVRAGLRSLRQWTIDVDLLMVLAALGAALIGAPFEGAMLLFLFSLSNVLQSYAIDSSRKAIHSLMKLRPDKALTRRGGDSLLLPIEELVVGDIVVVRPGESIPLDSVIVEGESSIDESSFTGESIPVLKKTNDPVFAATVNQTGGLEVRVTKLAKDSTIEKLIRMVEEAQSEKAETQRFLDRAEQFYAIGVIALTLALIVGLLFFVHEPFRSTFYRAMTVMVVASPCALIISTPASILSAIGGAARRGVLFKGGVHLERAATITVVALDKTGTLTEGKPRVTDLISVREGIDLANNVQPEVLDLLQLAASVEAKSEHPLAGAIVAEAKRRGLTLLNCTHFRSVSGEGASGVVCGRRIGVGNIRYLERLGGSINDDLAQRLGEFQDGGKTCVVVAETGEETVRILGALGIADVLRDEAPGVVRTLKQTGVQRVVMLTGDNHRVAAAIAEQAGVDEFHAELLPEDKVRVLKSLKTIGPVAMIGDGVNDAPALATATIGIAMGAAGTDVAMETADVVLMSDNLRNIQFALSISRHARTVIWQNLAIATAVIIALVVSALGFSLPLPLGVVGHEGSTVLVCLNGLRLLAFCARDHQVDSLPVDTASLPQKVLQRRTLSDPLGGRR
ncbi:MAG: heavy metal translocating P-type ATPase [Chthoniobacterales bacterium]